MANNYENPEAQAATATAMQTITVGLVNQVLAENPKLAPLAGPVTETTQVVEMATALATAIRRAIHAHKHAEGMAFAIANECVAEAKHQVRAALRAAAEAAPKVVLEEDTEAESLDLLEAVLEDVFADEALNLVEKKD
ncbi:uncharacterized protein PgNI_12218 [Pyricularia grisea]|uniref:Uncharacterized protein n=1 Tax=Pyricularia grisea TaxID=148305 RepID=A0A6P8AR75_PYRGI|nr:uncharacterized protein PgNI_12218 [Pyricularia grisea]TLD04546.1 hypothetical protein PgNI_12218 [Pyricularia grisea]